MHITKLLTLITLLFASSAFAIAPQTYTFVYILTGPATDIEPEAQQQAFAGHFANMGLMAEQGDLLAAGPYGPFKTDPMLRGLWIFNTDSVNEALEFAATDPPGKLGIFVFEAVQIVTDDALSELTRLEKEDEARRLADPEVADEWAGRGYTLAWAPTSSSETPDRIEGVLMIATMLKQEGTRIKEDHHLILMDSTSPEAAQKLLKKSGCNPANWQYDGWYTSTVLAQLPSVRE